MKKLARIYSPYVSKNKQKKFTLAKNILHD